MSRRFGMWAGLVIGCVLLCGCNNEKTDNSGGKPKTVTAPLKSKGPPSVFVSEEKIHNFGSMDQQQFATHVFEIRNEGEGELVLRIVDSSCGCTVVRMGDLVWNKEEVTAAPTETIAVQPGNAIDMELTWNTKLKSGQFTTVTTIDTNDPNQPRADFTVEGLIVPFVELSPASLRFDDARNNEVTTGYVYVYSKKLENLEITEVKSSNPLITAEFEPASEEFLSGMEAKSGLKASIKIEPGLPIGPFNAALTFKTNCEERPELTVAVSGQVGGDVTMTPDERISFGTVKTTESNTRGVFLKFRGESDSLVEVKEPRITLRRMDVRQATEKDTPTEAPAGIEVTNFLKVSVTKSETMKNFFQIKVEVPQGSPGGQFRGLVELETDHPTAKLVKIPVSVQVRK